ncbi:hypothetical protein C5167_040040 [Papaver somniferum]|uniref:Uncharacterized protein n=1 Tax=Papaver somniferum TaxID=3469 RepID=A0A4Y7II10_PAPSO|nr:hypothetical protein C5167_040040 [Papaver somniferum]
MQALSELRGCERCGSSVRNAAKVLIAALNNSYYVCCNVQIGYEQTRWQIEGNSCSGNRRSWLYWFTPAALRLLKDSYRVTIVGNLSWGNFGAVKVLQEKFPEPGRLQFISADLGDPKALPDLNYFGFQGLALGIIPGLKGTGNGAAKVGGARGFTFGPQSNYQVLCKVWEGGGASSDSEVVWMEEDSTVWTVNGLNRPGPRSFSGMDYPEAKKKRNFAGKILLAAVSNSCSSNMRMWVYWFACCSPTSQGRLPCTIVDNLSWGNFGAVKVLQEQFLEPE